MHIDKVEVHVHYPPLDGEQIEQLVAHAVDSGAATAPAETQWQVRTREVPGGVVLEVKPDVRNLLVNFGWMPPVEDGD